MGEIKFDSPEWTEEEIITALLVLKKIANTQWQGKNLPLAVYEAHLRGKVNFSIEMALRNGAFEYYVAPRPKGDVYEGKWHFCGVTFILTDAEAGDPTFRKAFERFEQEELGGLKFRSVRLLGYNVGHDPPRGPYIQFIFEGTVFDETPKSAAKTGGRWLSLGEIRKLDLVPSHRYNILPLLKK